MMGPLTEWDFYIGFGYGAVLAEATRRQSEPRAKASAKSSVVDVSVMRNGHYEENLYSVQIQSFRVLSDFT